MPYNITKELRTQRSSSKKIRVIFPNGEMICYTNAKKTFIETLKRIDFEELGKIDLKLCHLPLLTQTISESYKPLAKYMEPLGNGWYVNTESDSEGKYRQLCIINDSLSLDLAIDMSVDFKGERVSRGSKTMRILQVTFPDGTVIGEANTLDTFLQVVWHIGVDVIKSKGLEYGGKALITTAKLYNGQVQVDANRWLTIPNSPKDKVKVLKVIGAMLKIQLEIEYL